MTDDRPGGPAPEVWLSGPIEGVPPLLMPAAHALFDEQSDLVGKRDRHGDDLVDARRHAIGQQRDRGLREVDLVGEVLVERELGHVCLLADFADADAVHAVAHEQRQCGLDEQRLLLGLGRPAPLSRRGLELAAPGRLTRDCSTRRHSFESTYHR